MWIIPVLFLIAELACVVRVRASEPSMWGTSTTQPVPEGAAVALVFDRQEYFLGENILVHFVIENTGGVPFSSHWGGDSRGSSRPLRFKVTATDETGRVAEDPDPFPMCFGGFGGQHTLKPGEKFITTLALMRYCQIDKPGVYTIRATHDFGWKEGERKRPVGEAKITLRMPDATQAEGVVAQMEQLPEQPNAMYGQRGSDYADFGCLRQPVYLEPLLRRARAGNRRALGGLAGIPTPEATQAMIQLAGDSLTRSSRSTPAMPS